MVRSFLWPWPSHLAANWTYSSYLLLYKCSFLFILGIGRKLTLDLLKFKNFSMDYVERNLTHPRQVGILMIPSYASWSPCYPIQLSNFPPICIRYTHTNKCTVGWQWYDRKVFLIMRFFLVHFNQNLAFNFSIGAVSLLHSSFLSKEAASATTR